MKFSIDFPTATIAIAAGVLLSQPTLVEGRSTCPNDIFNPEAQLRYYGGFNMGLHNVSPIPSFHPVPLVMPFHSMHLVAGPVRFHSACY
jgi:hypothetical protein